MKTTFRLAQTSDAAAIVDIYRPYVENTGISFEIETPGLNEFTGRMESIQCEYPYIVCQQGETISGYAYAHRQGERAAYDWNAELSIYLSPESHGRGLGRKLYSILFEILKLQNVQNLYSLITLPNDKSVNLHESMGFNCLGVHEKTGYKMGLWRSVAWYGLSLGDHAVNPPPFIPITGLEPQTLAALLAGYSI
ncbi:N-acetyltransferase [Deltaproteobacteria bacterium Smac51]|nr:N-acetyltransferase [Deltaproteobacteria bacterium Smac51]